MLQVGAQVWLQVSPSWKQKQNKTWENPDIREILKYMNKMICSKEYMETYFIANKISQVIPNINFFKSLFSFRRVIKHYTAREYKEWGVLVCLNSVFLRT